jgi:hypothetical protein
MKIEEAEEKICPLCMSAPANVDILKCRADKYMWWVWDIIEGEGCSKELVKYSETSGHCGIIKQC